MKSHLLFFFGMLLGISISVNSQVSELHRFIVEGNYLMDNNVVVDSTSVYGTKYDGGDFGRGYLYRVNKDHSGYEIILHFDGNTTGAYPAGSLTMVNGLLYGVTSTGGANDMGTIFRVKKDGTDFHVVYHFKQYGEGSHPQALLLVDDTFYGVLQYGGVSVYGLIFKVGIDGQGFQSLHSFSETDGYGPSCPLVTDGTALYGTTHRGGTGDNGVIFRINMDGTGFAVMHKFNETDGDVPMGAIVCRNHFLYGTTLQGGDLYRGNFYKIGTDGNGFEVLGEFADYEGINPMGLIEYDDTFYGTTLNGGQGRGMVYKMDTLGGGFTPLLYFNVDNGADPHCQVTVNGSKLYARVNGGSQNYGAIFSLNLDGSGYDKIWDFESTNDGYDPIGPVINVSSRLYGITAAGGKYNRGVIFAMNKDGSGYQVVHDFTGSDGRQPVGNLVLENNLLFGATSMGGIDDVGVIFNFDPVTDTFQKIFDGSLATAAWPSGICIQESVVYGLAIGGGIDDRGVIFKMETDGSGYTTLYNLFDTQVQRPHQSPVISGSTLFGMANTLEGFKEALFSVQTDGTGFNIMHISESEEDGMWGQTIVPDGDSLYVITSNGGSTNMGVIYHINTDGSDYTPVFRFSSETGGVPYNPMILKDGYLYGTTSIAGPGGSGGVFRVRTDGTEFENLLDFSLCFGTDAEKKASTTKWIQNKTGWTEYASGSASTQGAITLIDKQLYIVASQTGSSVQDARVFSYNLIPNALGDDRTATHLSLFPNPAQGYVNLEGLRQFPARIGIYNVQGTLLEERLIYDRQIPCNHLAPGVYSIYAEGQWLKMIKL